MKKGEFDLEGKAVDCSGLPALDDAGKEIFRAIFIASGIKVKPDFNMIDGYCSMLSLYMDGGYSLSVEREIIKMGLEIIQPSDVLGQDAIDAAMDGANIVFEGDVIPDGAYLYYQDSKYNTTLAGGDCSVMSNTMILAYKLFEETPSIEPPETEKNFRCVTMPDLGDSFKRFSDAVNKEFPSRVLAEKVGLKELKHVDSGIDWQEREAETYDELRDSHLELLRENMNLKDELAEAKHRIKNLERKINDARANLDE